MAYCHFPVTVCIASMPSIIIVAHRFSYVGGTRQEDTATHTLRLLPLWHLFSGLCEAPCTLNFLTPTNE